MRRRQTLLHIGAEGSVGFSGQSTGHAPPPVCVRDAEPEYGTHILSSAGSLVCLKLACGQSLPSALWIYDPAAATLGHLNEYDRYEYDEYEEDTSAAPKQLERTHNVMHLLSSAKTPLSNTVLSHTLSSWMCSQSTSIFSSAWLEMTT